MLCMAYRTLLERKVIGWIQVRNGTTARAVDCSSRSTRLKSGKEIIILRREQILFITADMSMMRRWRLGGDSFAPALVLANSMRASVLMANAWESMRDQRRVGVQLQVRVLGAMRSGAKCSYEIARGFALVRLMASRA